MSVPPISHQTEQPWTNWGGNQTCTPAFIVRPTSEREALEVVRFAIREGLPVRAVGAGHSFTPIVQTGGILMETDALAGITGTDTARRRVRMLGGTKIGDLGEPLWDAGLALSNQGDIDKQSISGAIATATHGSGIDYTSFSERLRWVRLVTGHGEVVEIDESDLRRLRAAQVAVGTLGIMTEVELEVSPRYHLREQISYPRWDELRRDLATEVASNRHFSFLWCPRSDSAALYELSTPAGLDMTNRAYTKKYVQVDLEEPKDLVTEDGKRADRAYRIYPGGFGIPFHELEYYVPAEHGLAAIEAMQELMRTTHPNQPYPLETRWVKADDAYLSPFYHRDTTVLSVSGPPGTDYWPYLRDVDALLREFDARTHWGKLHLLSRQRVEKLYPEFNEFLAVRREFDPQGVFLNDSTRRLLG